MKITFKNREALWEYFYFLGNYRRYIPEHIIKRTPLGYIYDPNINKYVKVLIKVDDEDN